MRALTLILLLAFSSVASAQSDPAAPPVEDQRPVVQLQLTAQQQHLLDAGEISMGKWFTGGALSTFVGFGVGQAVQGRYRSRGWMFTVGDSVALTVTLYGAARCCGPAGHKEEYAVLAGADVRVKCRDEIELIR